MAASALYLSNPRRVASAAAVLQREFHMPLRPIVNFVQALYALMVTAVLQTAETMVPIAFCMAGRSCLRVLEALAVRVA